MCLEPIDILLIQLGLLVAAGYAFAVFVYVKKPAYRSAIMKGVLLWAVLWILLGVSATADFLRGNPETFEGLVWVGLPLTLVVDLDMSRRFFGYRTQYFIAQFLFFANWCWVFATGAVGIKALCRRCRR